MKYLRIVMLLAGMILMAGGATFLVNNYLRAHEAHGWPRAQARIVESRVETVHAQEVGNEGEFRPLVRYDYTVRGHVFHGDMMYLDERRSFGSANVAARELVFLEVGTETEVMYNPHDPQEAALIVDKPTWRWFFLFLLGALLARFGWGFWRAGARQQPTPQAQGRPQTQPQTQPAPRAQITPQLQVSPDVPLTATAPETMPQG